MIHALAPGTQLKSINNIYTIRSVLGSGGFGITYSASFSTRIDGMRVNATVAIKEHFIAADCERDLSTHSITYSGPARLRVESSRKDFAGEARRLQQVCNGSDNIIQVSEVFDANNTSYYVMEHIDGPTLAQYVGQRGRLSESEMLQIMLPIVKAVGYLHTNRITHLDIKPANILIAHYDDGAMRPVLIDFGLSKHYNSDGSATSTINTRGYSDGYAPVEQYAGISSFSPVSDVYSLAATMLFCLTGRTPQRSVELYPEVLDSLLPANLSPALKMALRASLSMTLHQRPADANKLYDAIAMGGGYDTGRTSWHDTQIDGRTDSDRTARITEDISGNNASEAWDRGSIYNFDEQNASLNTVKKMGSIGNPNESGKSGEPHPSWWHSGGMWFVFIAAGLFVLALIFRECGGHGAERYMSDSTAEDSSSYEYYDDYSVADSAVVL